tara:strand:- start:1072 stop:1431 length:360 start_codon:yes stop_codon:yes gene_type:complete
MGFIQMKLPKRIRHKIENSKRNRQAQANHEEWLQSQGLDTYTLKQRSKKFKGYEIPKYQSDPNQPKCGDKIPVNGGVKKEEMKYSGKRKLIGIGLMHKSNLVPIWDEEGAKEISTMRRN